MTGRAGAVAVAAAATSRIECPAGVPPGSPFGPAVMRSLSAGVAHALESAIAAAPPSEDFPAGAASPIFLLAGAYNLRRVEDFAAQVRRSGSNVRPTASADLEPSRLLQAFVDRNGWEGECYATGSPSAAAGFVVALAGQMILCGAAPSAVVCEVLPAPGNDWLVSVAVLMPAAGGHDQQVDLGGLAGARGLAELTPRPGGEGGRSCRRQ